MISRRSVISLSRDQVSTDLAGEAAILNLVDGVYYGLNEAGAFIWRMLQEPKTVADICAGMMAEYDVDSDRCEMDVLELLEELQSKGLIEVRNETRA